MSGKRLLDAAAIFKASRGVATKYLGLRRHQFDAYSKTSTIAKAIKNQTDRVILTARAASALAERFNGPGPAYSTQAKGSNVPEQNASAPSQDTVRTTDAPGTKQGIVQDHFYESLLENSTTEPLPDAQLEVKQARAKTQPLPDDSSPSVGIKVGSARHEDEVPSSRPSSEPFERPVSGPTEGGEADTGLEQPSFDVSGKSSHSASAKSPSADEAKQLQRRAERQIPSQTAEPPPIEASMPSGSQSSTAAATGSPAKQQQDVFYSPSTNTSAVLSSLPRQKLPKTSAETQESDPRVPDERMNQEVFYSSGRGSQDEAVPEVQALPEQEGPSDEMYSELFHSPKVAKMLKGQLQEGKSSKGLELTGAKDARLKERKSPKDEDQETFSSLVSEDADTANQTDSAARQISEGDTSEEGTRQFAEDLANDIEKESSSAEVGHLVEYCL